MAGTITPPTIRVKSLLYVNVDLVLFSYFCRSHTVGRLNPRGPLIKTKPNLQVEAKKTVCITLYMLRFSIFFFAYPYTSQMGVILVPLAIFTFIHGNTKGKALNIIPLKVYSYTYKCILLKLKFLPSFWNER